MIVVVTFASNGYKKLSAILFSGFALVWQITVRLCKIKFEQNQQVTVLVLKTKLKISADAFSPGKSADRPKPLIFFSKPTKSGRFKTPLFFRRPTTRCRHLNEVSPNQASPSQRNVASQQLFFFRGGHLQFLSRVVGAEKMEAAKKGLNQ